MTGPALTGFATSLSLILAIGAQNAFVLRQGLMQRHVFALCLFCALSDAALIAAGVAGFGTLARAAPWLPTALTLGGAAFLLAYGALRIRAALRGGHALAADGRGGSVWAVLGTAAAITWLNPHVYLDTLALIGAVSMRFAPGADRMAFGLGAVAASFVFFFALGYGARLLAPVMASPRAWRVLDLGIGVVMWTIAAGLVLSL
ncbi:LysE/ArgO family amino acid transporter [Rhodovulum euryhalinum]|uniref:L-lysine exporter family protein LysE/ArgO n=1 Tax=Rhodovulum euryhalinum TaxID=35805 RepID=A0A4R2KCB1_9RHOB|nr:LysE/ArgO family amino acid transporter [Rhodovulum euryhalinum]TCO69727.1 L-lysine exporter family protein LysE/ArgO [Rhodovulum euryhalinum]